MNINLRTDAPRHNLALMKISSYHKALGDRVFLNGAGEFGITYGSWLFDFSPKYFCDVEGGPGIDASIRLDEAIEFLRPDYDLFGLDFSLGYTWRYCPRNCEFCIVPEQKNKRDHKSIWDFHDPRFKKICLLNNNTFSDPLWYATFEEIWEQDLVVIDENGYDLRLMTDDKAHALKCTSFEGYIHYAWDQMCDEAAILRGLAVAPKGIVYVLVGFDTTPEEDLHRLQKIHDAGHDPYVMPYGKTKYGRALKRFVDSRMYRKFKSMGDAWGEWK